MIIAMIKGVTRICGKSQGYLGLPVRDMVINDKVNGKNTPAMDTAWTPTPDELERLNKGANIIVRCLGTVPVPMMVMVDTELPPMEECTLYRYQYIGEMGGYVVYRAENTYDAIKSPRREWINVHRQAVFITEANAKWFCKMRNEMTIRNGSDALPDEPKRSTTLCRKCGQQYYNGEPHYCVPNTEQPPS